MYKHLSNFVKILMLMVVLFLSEGDVIANGIPSPEVGRQLTDSKSPTATTPPKTPTQEKGYVDKIVELSAPAGSVLATLFPSTKNCNYVKDTQYQPFSGIDKTFPGAESLGVTEVTDRNGTEEKGKKVTCINVSGGTEGLLKILFTMLISIIIIMSVINISVSGIQYMTEEAIGKISGGARKRLQNSFVALGLGLMSYAILYTVNKQLVAFNFDPSSIDKDGSIDKGKKAAADAAAKQTPFSTAFGSIDALSGPSTPGSPYVTPGVPNGSSTLVDAFNSTGSWNETVAENWIRGLASGERSMDGRFILSIYSATKDKTILDQDSKEKRGNRNNLLREGSVALSPDLISKYKPQTGQEIFINGTSIGFYEDATAASFKGVPFRNTFDVYDENGTIGGTYLKIIPTGQWSISFGAKREQITNKK